MKTMKFKCTLLSDLILSQSSSTEGTQQTLDFIPGNNFLGLVAKELYQDGSSESLALFHSGKVRFGDAHPSANGVRSLKVPASMFYPKLSKASEECYVHHLITNLDDLKEKQLKQCRDGFYVFEDIVNHIGHQIRVEKSFVLKSAYDANTRKSMDHQMFGYQSMTKGSVFYFEIESDLDDSINAKINKSLIGIRHIGRSRTAEYGIVRIEKFAYQDISSSATSVSLDGTSYHIVYADSRLVFLDENGEPTFQPSAVDLGFKDGKIVWEKSQIRTFQYAPWNGKRHTYDAERCGIEKGSVFVVRNCSACPSESKYVGNYNNEGFGKVIYNPAFLEGAPNQNGKAKYKLQENQATTSKPDAAHEEVTTKLISYLKSKQSQKKTQTGVYEIVDQFIGKNEKRYEGISASQWGSIRSWSMLYSNPIKLIDVIKDYLSHGVAKDKWDKHSRATEVLKFMEAHTKDDLQSIMINLASEMAKKSSKEGK